MIKGFALIPKKPDISRERFHHHWRDVHAPLAKRIKSLRRYVQSHRIDTPVPGFDAIPYEGIAEIWFDDLKSVRTLGDNPDYLGGAYLDEPNFIDPVGPCFLATREQVVIDEVKLDKGTAIAKVLFLLKRKAGMSVADFQTYWRDEHAPQIPRDRGVLRYVQCHQAPETYEEQDAPAFDGVAELWFKDPAAFERYWGDPEVQQIFASDAPRFLAAEGSVALQVEEIRVIWPQGGPRSEP